MMRILLALSLGVAIGLPQAARAADATAGHRVFKQVCAACHSDKAGQNRIGPSLFDVVGRKSGTEAGYHFSKADRTANLTWDPATLDKFLTSPRAEVPGTKMPYAGLKNAQKRADLIAYLQTLK